MGPDATGRERKRGGVEMELWRVKGGGGVKP